ncbi:MAG TPA: tetratricopeptide repeat protein [Pseudolabrys sp.]|nr:tetratricopeptide repeat protein [Pseudolabrys sp.]
MTDIFHEVDEEVRRERLQKLWERYSIYIIGVAVLIVAAMAAWRGYEWWIEKQAAEAGSKFEQALTLSEEGKHADAEQAFAKIAADAPAGYRVLARFRAAAELAQDKPADAVKAYDQIAADGSFGQTMQDLAALRAGMLLVDTAPLAELEKRLAPLAEPGRPFRASAREMLALSAWRNHDAAAARKYIDMLTADAETPPGARTRAEVLSALLAAGGKS